MTQHLTNLIQRRSLPEHRRCQAVAARAAGVPDPIVSFGIGAGTYAASVAILVDPATWPGRGRLWCHLVSDTSFDELHDFARRCGIPDRAFERDHYDVPAERRADVVAAGAVEVRSRELVARITAAGLRRPKHR